MYCSYLIGYFLLQLTQTTFSMVNDEDGVFSVAARDGETKEPSCEELHRMWRLTKREIQQKLDMTPPSPRYKGRYLEPMSYGWKSPARPRTAGYSQPVYGRLVLSPGDFRYRNVPNRQRSYEQVARMVGGSSPYFTGTNNAPQKPTYFRLDYPNPVRRPLVPMRISHIGRFQELQNVLRDDRAKEMTKLKQTGDGGEAASSDFPNDESDSRKYNTYSPSNGDDTTAGNTNDRKFRESNGQDRTADSSYADENNTGSETRNESEKSQSTSKPVMTDDTIVHRWALGEWRR